MVEYTLLPLDDDSLDRMLEQNDSIKHLLDYGALLNYTVAEDVSKVWMIFDVKSEAHLITMLDIFPLSNVSNYKITKLLHHVNVHFTNTSSLN